MSNLSILKRVKELYKPETAFGNNEILELFAEIVEPNKNGVFEIEGVVERIVRVQWSCVDCGRDYRDEFDVDDEVAETHKTCDCGARHLIKIID